MNCKTCKFWKRTEDFISYQHTNEKDPTHTWREYEFGKPRPSYGFLVSDVITKPSHLGNCTNPKIVYTQSGGGAVEDFNKIPIDGFGYTDAEAYSAYHLTGEDFGCIHWSQQ